MPDFQSNKVANFTDTVEQTLASAPPRSITSYALQSFAGLMRRQGAERPDEALLRLWVTEMLLGGKKGSTVRRYLGKVRAVYGQFCPDGDGAFANVSAALESAGVSCAPEAAENLKLTARVSAAAEEPGCDCGALLFMYLLYDPTATVADAAALTFGSVPDFCPQIADTVSRCDSSHGRKYVFALGQGKVRRGEVIRRATEALRRAAENAGMRVKGGFTRESVTAIWVAAALQTGINAADINAAVETLPHEYAFLAIAGKSGLSRREREALICRVADAINSRAQRWFVMRLRRGVGLDEVRGRVDMRLRGDSRASLTFYYPTRAEIRKEGRRRIVTDVPYLPATVFFRTRRDRVRSLMAEIGDLAWCFRSAGDAGSDYAIIPDRQMAEFQRYVGNFTPDIRLELVCGDAGLGRGRRVRVTGGIMEGYEGTILDVEGQPGQRVFTLALTGGQQARWTAHVDDIYLAPLD